MHPLFIDIEGLHGVGKSEIVMGVARAINAEYIPTVPDEFEDVRKVFNQTDNVNARYCFFLAAVLYSSDKIRQALIAGKNVVVESYLYRTIAFHKGMGAKIDVSLPYDVPMPDVTFHLRCSESVRAMRLINRNNGSPRKGQYDLLAENNQQRILEEYKKFPMVEVDTTNKQPGEVIDTIKNKIKYEFVFEKLLG